MSVATNADLEAVIGLEVHAQILTKSKMFCACNSRYFGAPPNSHVCAVCGGFPGALPLINRRAVEATILTGLALRCDIARHFKFDRKNYAYPDLPKGYQITQYDLPIARNGHLDFMSNGDNLSCGITRVHLEEDTGKSTHDADGEARTLIDYNRSGVPLMEIVGEPNLHTAQAARDYFIALREMLMYLGVNDGNLQEGSLRADVNVSICMPDGAWGTKVEIKNLNSFRAVFRAVEFEEQRQRELVHSGRPVAQETRGWSDELGRTLGQRSKEYAHDYRYFPEPDLPPVDISEAALTAISVAMPELPAKRRARLSEQYLLDNETADVLTSNQALGHFYEATLSTRSTLDPRLTARWLTQDVLGLCNDRGIAVEESALTSNLLSELVDMLQSERITGKTAKEVLSVTIETGVSPRAVVEQRGLAQTSDLESIGRWVDDAMNANPKAIADYLGGKEKAMEAIVGRVMAVSRGKANVDSVRRLVRERIESGR